MNASNGATCCSHPRRRPHTPNPQRFHAAPFPVRFRRVPQSTAPNLEVERRRRRRRRRLWRPLSRLNIRQSFHIITPTPTPTPTLTPISIRDPFASSPSTPADDCPVRSLVTR